MKDQCEGWPDKDLRHPFTPTARDRSICIICLKSKSHLDHISQRQYDLLKAAYEATASLPHSQIGGEISDQ